MRPSSYLWAIVTFLREDDGPTAVEYAVMLAMIIVVCITSVGFLATQTGDSFDASAEAINGALAN